MTLASLSAVEIIAFVFAILALLKILIIIAKPKLWMQLSDKVIGNKALFTLIAIILVLITGYYVLQSEDIVTIGAVMAFTASLMALTMAPHSKLVLELREKTAGNMLRKSWLSVVLWVVLAVWIIYKVAA